jgi:hypothetical protein
MDVVVHFRLLTLSSSSSSTSESREGVASVESKRGEAQIVVVVVEIVGAVCGSLPRRQDCAHHFVVIGRCVCRRSQSRWLQDEFLDKPQPEFANRCLVCDT